MYAIIDASEVFIEMLGISLLRGQTISTITWQNLLWLVAISFVSPLCILELTCASEFTESLSGKTGVSIMADRGFTNSDQLAPYGIKLNISLFMEYRSQNPAEDIRKGCKIASLRIHVERAIRRIKNFTILKGTLSFSMSRTANQIAQVCQCLVNFS